ncbi:MAG: hypothetical protein MJA82_08475 [Clostridia bacterium]|nr:hypothetical protein [Clostridia bacterium]
MKRFACILLIFTFLIMNTLMVYAIECREINGDEIDEKISVDKWEDGSLRKVYYAISSSLTNANSGTRYKTSKIYIDIAGFTLPIDIETEVMEKGIKPNPGQTVWHMISINAEDILEKTPENLKNNVENILNNNPEDIEIRSRIEIYDVATGKSLEIMETKKDVMNKADDWGFSPKHIQDMLTRYKTKPKDAEIRKEKPKESKQKGLRPTISVDKPLND